MNMQSTKNKWLWAILALGIVEGFIKFLFPDRSVFASLTLAVVMIVLYAIFFHRSLKSQDYTRSWKSFAYLVKLMLILALVLPILLMGFASLVDPGVAGSTPHAILTTYIEFAVTIFVMGSLWYALQLLFL